MHSFIAVMLACLAVFASNLSEARAASPLRLAMSFELRSLHEVRAKNAPSKAPQRTRRSSSVEDAAAIEKHRPVVSLGQGRLSIQADGVTLGAVLAELESLGVKVRLPEHLAARKVRTHFTKLKLGVGLRRLLRGLSYVATFDRTQDPSTQETELALADLRVLTSGAKPELVEHAAIAAIERVPRVAQY